MPLKSVKDLCTPHPLALDFALGDQIEDLSTAIGDAAVGEAFFKKNYLTAGMQTLLEMGLKRLDGRDKQAVFELTQAMGGGKTHTMVAFGLLAKHPDLRKLVVPDQAGRCTFGSARVVSFSGRNYPDHFVWGEIASQVGKPGEFEKYWKSGPVAPDEAAWSKLLGEDPILILLDELPPYLENAITKSVGGGTLAQVATAALSNLFAAALKLPRVCIVMSNLSGSYERAAADLHKVIRNLENETRRQAKPITPVELGGDEIYQILKKRLFAKLPGMADVEAVADAFAAAIAEAEKSKSIAKSTEQIANDIRLSYPFHPSIKDIVALFRNNENYRQTRGLMQFVARMISSVWKRPSHDVFLIGLQHLDLNDPDVREEISRISDLRGAIASDVAAGGSAHAEVIDQQTNSDAGSQVATILLASSLSTAIEAVKGLTKQRMLEFLVAPLRPALDFAEAFEHLRAEAWYLHKDRSEAYYFANTENLTKRLASEAQRAPGPKIDKELRRRLQIIFKPEKKNAYQELYALPTIDEVKVNGPRVLLILSPDATNPPADAKKFYESIVEKNNLCILTGDSSDIVSLEEKTRMIWAVAKVKEELPESDPKQAELDEKLEAAEQDFNATVTSIFNRIWYPAKAGLSFAKLAMQFSENTFNGEEQIEKALIDIGASKLVVEFDKDPTQWIKRAEDMLWPENTKRVPWRDIKRRSLENPRWIWLPNNGLEQLRKLAEQRGAWRSTDDGYIERGPFENPKTEVTVTEVHYVDDTGEATLEVVPRNAGKAPEVYWDTKADVTRSAGHKLSDNTFKTKAVRVWFLAVDPSKAHETGAATSWSNRLTLRHQCNEGVGGDRNVELAVIPAGAIRYTLNGANPKEGTPYEKPFPIGPEETTVYCYAEADGVAETRNFLIAKAGNTGVQVDPDHPARLRKKIDCPDTAQTFGLLAKIRQAKAKTSSLTLDVGQGDKAVSVRFGSGTALTGEVLEQAIAMLRSALVDETADVRLQVKVIHFPWGRDLSTFVAEQGLVLAPNEVEQ
jgi:hypothetical protein